MKKTITRKTDKFELEIKESLSPLFSLAKIYVMHTGMNVNGSIISKEAVERNIDSIKNIPIVGEYVREDNNFLGHGGELTIEDNEIRYLNTTVPIGVIPENAKVVWETVTDTYGESHDYLVVENALIWNRDDKMVKALKSDEFGQSMEITITDCEELPNGYLDIQDFFFTAFCVLGIDRDGVGYVQPAFDNASIKTYSDESKKDFESSFNDMLKDFKLAFGAVNNLVEEDRDLNLEDLLKQYELTQEQLSEKIPEFADFEIADLEVKIKELFEDNSEESVEAETEVDESTEEVEVEEEVTETETEEVEKETEAEETETVVEEVVETEIVEADENIVEYEAKIALLEEENAELKSKVESLEGQVVSYEKAEHERVCYEKINEFVEGYNLDKDQLDIQVHEFSNVDELESKLFELVGRLAKKEFAKKDTVTSKIKNDLEVKKTNVQTFGFEALFEKK